jgi:NMD protein affecting ribosome stability and mRNA decay
MIDIDRMTLIDEDVPLVLSGLTLKNYRSYAEFYVCRQCGKVYWQGTHWQRRLDRQRAHEQQLHVDDNHELSDDSDGIVFYDAKSEL